MARSGTTMLRLMLTAHPRVCIAPESRFFIQLEPRHGQVPDLSGVLDDFLEDLYRNDRFQEWRVERALLSENLKSVKPLTYARATAIVYQTYGQRIHPDASIWGDKNPVNIYSLETIRQYFPNARLLLIHRDVRSIYNSLLRNEKNFPAQWKSSCIANVVSVTKQFENVITVLERYRNDDRFRAISYEALVRQPETELRKLCAWLGLDFTEEMLSFYKQNQEKQLVPTRELGWHARTLNPVDIDRLEPWRDEISTTELAALETLNQDNLEKLGYQCMALSSSISAPVYFKILSNYVQHVCWRRNRFLPNFLKREA